MILPFDFGDLLPAFRPNASHFQIFRPPSAFNRKVDRRLARIYLATRITRPITTKVRKERQNDVDKPAELNEQWNEVVLKVYIYTSFLFIIVY